MGQALYNLLLNGTQKTYAKGEILQFGDENKVLSLVQTGYIKRYSIDNDGSEGIQVINGPDDIFPLTPIFKTFFGKDISSGTRTYYYGAMTDATISSVTQAMLKEAADNNPIIYKDLLAAAAVRFESNIQRLENMSLRTTHRRIAHLLVYFADKFGEVTPQGLAIKAPLTHQTLAEILNVARETITRRLTRLEEKGLIKASGKNIIVLSIEKLKAEIR